MPRQKQYHVQKSKSEFELAIESWVNENNDPTSTVTLLKDVWLELIQLVVASGNIVLATTLSVKCFNISYASAYEAIVILNQEMKNEQDKQDSN